MNSMTMQHFAYEPYNCAHEPATVVQEIATATLYKQATEFKGVVRSMTRTTFLINIDATLQSPIGYSHQSISGHLNFHTTIVATHGTDVIMSNTN